MRFLQSSTIIPALFASYAFAGPLEKRLTVTDIDTIVVPADGSSITPGTPFTFQYQVDNWCEAGYTPLSVWLVANEPTGSDVNSTAQISDSLYYFGNWLILNFGLPAMTNPPPPPSTLTLPNALPSEYDGTEVYIAVVQTSLSCPPDGHTEYGLASNNLQYSA
ncbi:hypothetical protein EW026_g4605 [Hermanssonia centrifuga]|uniref:Uncharacterized protein n=1 Tax=Hermanssonia centrifuga TaxID=98765 RepID=A0A4S4KID1_9APHY|nr:hypothetical protein EW026_g4605 [Hermanssonia centrifuga]